MKIPEAIEGDYGKEVKVYLRKGQLADEWSTSQHELKSSSNKSSKIVLRWGIN
ncbi:hypothetical protein Bca4012_041186 [Brassica carinata]